MHLYGNDLNSRMVEAAKLNLLLHGLPPDNICHGDGLDLRRVLSRWFQIQEAQPSGAYWDSITGPFDYVVANPPFAGHEKNPKILARISSASRSDRSTRALNKTIPFLEVIVAALKEGGVAGIVLPTSILNAEESSFKRFRELLLSRVELVAIIGLPEKAFVHTDCGIHGALLFFRRCSTPRKNYQVFVDWADHLGYDRLGRPTRENDFPGILERYRRSEWPDGHYVSVRDLNAFDRWDPTWLRFVLSASYTLDEHNSVPLSSLVEFRNARWSRKQIDQEAQYRFFEVSDADIRTGEVSQIKTATGFELMKKSRIRVQVLEGDILMPNHRDSLMATGAVNGRSIVVASRELDGVLTTDRFLVLRPKVAPEVVSSILNSRGVRRQLVAQCRGAASLEIKESMFESVRVPKEILETERISQIVELVTEVAILREALQRATSGLDSLVEHSFGGNTPIRPPAAI